MFYHIEGVVVNLEPNLAVLDCGGVGFALFTTSNTIAKLHTGDKAKLYVHAYIREGVFDLYGFYDVNEKRSFELLIAVSGVGPKAALSVLSSGTPESLALAIITGDEKSLTVAPGIGKKIAQRIILELKDKMAKETQDLSFSSEVGGTSAAAGVGKWADAASALAVLGYSSSEISQALKNIDESLPLEEIIRQALRGMLRQ